MKRWFARNSEKVGAIIAIVILMAVIATFVFLISNKVKADDEFNAWYESLTPEEQAEYEAPYTTTHDLVNVSKYIRNITNRNGGVRGSIVCYEFSYFDNGEIKSVCDFNPSETGSQRIVIGDTNSYIVNERTNIRTLQLTEETFASLTLSN